MLLVKDKRAEMEVILKIISWAVFLGIMILVLLYLFRTFGV